jgi:hypothetical protein
LGFGVSNVGFLRFRAWGFGGSEFRVTGDKDLRLIIWAEGFRA